MTNGDGGTGQDKAHDSDVTNDPSGPSGGVGPWVGDKGLVELDPTMDIPVVSPVIYAGAELKDGWDGFDDLTAIGGMIASLSVTGITYAMDPLSTLLNAGLAFLVDVVQPLEDLLGLITGNSERILGEYSKWERVANALGPLAEEIREATNDGLLSWKGDASEAAKERLNAFADGVAGLANDATGLMTVLNFAKAAMSVVQAIIIGLIAGFVEWLIITWTAAMAAAGPTFGGSTAAAGTATTVTYASKLSTTVRYLDRFASIMSRIQRVLHKLHRKSVTDVTEKIRPNKAGTLKADIENMRGATFATLRMPSTYILASPSPTSYGVIGALDDLWDYDKHEYSDEELDDKLGG